MTYLGLMGSGYMVPLAILVLQVAVPGVLIWNLFSINPTPTNQCTETSTFGYNEICISDVSKAMALVIVFYYFCKVVPDTLYDFYETTGTADSAYSRLCSLRRQVWKRGDDRLEQMIGFRMDIYMNTAYVT
eukprot:CAMPEP_0116565008 /NCGR_PEP_ID=MMETSP0397-20121206/13657_1 /TAXON_ID=216820 /ORGANISM="Cyclophora tenuis, Strain ECT3854" /LENGTH=130 /DNA_ID=CAMNT_0004091729 /DNA_START=102 /DNA_END=491 /DNA_ORIENTATION=+